MICPRHRFLLLLLGVVVLVRQVPAQVGNPFSAESQPLGPSNPTTEDAASSGGSDAEYPSNAPFTDWPVLVIPGVADLGGLSGVGAVVGAGVSGGYGHISNGDLGNPSGFISVAQPYVGLFQAGYRDKVLAEYSPTIDLYNKDKWDGTVLQAGGIRGYADLTRRVRWVFSGYSSYGTEYVRELQGLAIGEYPNWLTFAAPTDTVFAASVATGLHWRIKPLTELSLSVGDSYSSVRGVRPVEGSSAGEQVSSVEAGSHYDAASARAQLTNYFGRESSWWGYAQAARYSDQPGCTRVGFSGGFAWNISASTGFSLEGGPEFGSGTCVVQLTGNFGGSLSHRFTSTTVFYLSAIRDLIDPHLIQSRWTDIYSAKLWQKLSRNTSIVAGAGYQRSSDLPGQVMSHYSALLLFSEFHWRISESLSSVSGYRYFKREFVNPGFEGHDSWVFCSIVFHPQGRGTRRD